MEDGWAIVHQFPDMLTIFFPDSDGIARVHGMANVQAEELVECVPTPIDPCDKL